MAVRGRRLVTALLAVGLMLPLGLPASSVAARNEYPGRVEYSYLEARGLWRAALPGVPRPGLTTRLMVFGHVFIGFDRDDRNRKSKFSEACVTVYRAVVDRRGDIVHPSGRGVIDDGCADVPRDSVEADQSSAVAPRRVIRTTRSVWVCPDGPFEDCYTVEREGPLVRFRASWRAVTELVDFLPTCVEDDRVALIANRDAESWARVDGLAMRGDGRSGEQRITRFTSVRTECS